MVQFSDVGVKVAHRVFFIPVVLYTLIRLKSSFSKIPETIMAFGSCEDSPSPSPSGSFRRSDSTVWDWFSDTQIFGTLLRPTILRTALNLDCAPVENPHSKSLRGPYNGLSDGLILSNPNNAIAFAPNGFCLNNTGSLAAGNVFLTNSNRQTQINITPTGSVSIN